MRDDAEKEGAAETALVTTDRLPALTPEQVKSLVRRASQFKASANIDLALRLHLENAGLSEDDWRQIIETPELATAVKKEADQKFRAVLPILYDHLFDQAVNKGKGWAYKLYMQRFDEEYVERKESRKGAEGEIVTFEDFNHAMRLRFGEESWEAARALARDKGVRGGVCGENYLPGGDAEFDEAKCIEAEATPIEADVPDPHLFD